MCDGCKRHNKLFLLLFSLWLQLLVVPPPPYILSSVMEAWASEMSKAGQVVGNFEELTRMGSH